jgi:hypothetical protein
VRFSSFFCTGQVVDILGEEQNSGLTGLYFHETLILPMAVIHAICACHQSQAVRCVEDDRPHSLNLALAVFQVRQDKVQE